MDYIRNLIDFLNKHTALYNEGTPIIDDESWDEAYFELQKLERETGIIYPDSPTQSLLYELCPDGLQKVTHSHPMLSLAKTKSIEEVKEFLRGQNYVAMCKMDGLTCSLIYEEGQLVGAETRGDGLVGEDVLHNAKIIKNIPRRISYTKRLVVDGEIISTYSNFKNWENTYKNPRNFAAGSIRLLDSLECNSRGLEFVAWNAVEGLGDDMFTSMVVLSTLGFTIVPMSISGDLEKDILKLQKDAETYSYPIDGIVFKFNDKAYGRSLGRTEHHFNDAIAYKFCDETYETCLLDIEYETSRKGLLTPVAVFEPIDIDGTEVSRASLFNLSVMENTLGAVPFKGQRVCVSKRNMIIPHIESAEKVDNPEEDRIIPLKTHCMCGEPTSIVVTEAGIKNLVCSNANCEFKLINRLDHFASKKGLDIKGLSTSTLEKLLDKEWINSLSSIFELKQYRSEWIQLEGFGVRSVDKILEAIEDARTTTFEKFIVSLGIPLIGSSVAKDLAKHFDYSYENFREAIDNKFDFCSLEGFAEGKSEALLGFDYEEADKIYYSYLTIDKTVEEETCSTLEGLTFVITGRLNNYKRAELQSLIEQMGGKTAGSVSRKTDYLINNDSKSSSAKNVTAQELGVKIITEAEFIEKFLI